MTRIEITSKDAERLAKSFTDLIGPKGLLRIRRKAVNEIGSGVRKETRVIGPVVIGTSAAALMVRGTAASPGSDNPKYSLRMAAKIPVEKLKASKRKITRRRGKSSLRLTLPGGDKISFRSIARVDGRFRLLKAGPLAERSLGGIYTNAARAFTKEDGYPELHEIRRGAGKDLIRAVAAAVNEHLKRSGR